MNNENMVNDLLNKITGTEEKAYKIKMVKAFKEEIALDSMNKYDYGFSLSSKDIKKVLEENDFQLTLQKLGYDLSMEGKGYGLAVFRYKGKNIIEKVKINKIVKLFGVTTEAVFHTDEKWEVEEKKYKLYGRFFLDENKKVKRETGAYINGFWIRKEDEEIVEYDTTMIPVMSFTNNPLGTPDLTKESEKIMKQAESFFNRIPREFEKGKLIYAFNNIINSTNTGKNFERQVIKGGKDTFDLNDPDGAIANSMAPMVNGMAGLEMIEKLYSFYEKKALKLSLLYHDHGPDSRKSEYDLLSYNQRAFEMMTTKIKHRERQLQKFINMLAAIIHKNSGKIKLVVSPFEENRIKSLKATTELKLAQAKQAKGIAEKNTMEAETMREAIKKGNAESVVNSTQQPADVAKNKIKGSNNE